MLFSGKEVNINLPLGENSLSFVTENKNISGENNNIVLFRKYRSGKADNRAL